MKDVKMTQIAQDKDQKDCQEAIAFYVQARTDRKLLPLTIILGLWGTANWSDRSKDMFLEAVRAGLECDRISSRRFVAYTRAEIESYLLTRSRSHF